MEHILLLGDEETAQKYIGLAKKKLTLLKSQMSLLKIPSDKKKYYFDEVTIVVSSNYGYDKIIITAEVEDYYIIVYVGKATYEYIKKYYKYTANKLKLIDKIDDYTVVDDGVYHVSNPHSDDYNPYNFDYDFKGDGYNLPNPNNGIAYKKLYGNTVRYVMSAQYEKDLFIVIEQEILNSAEMHVLISPLALVSYPYISFTQGTNMKYLKDKIIFNTLISTKIDPNINQQVFSSFYSDNTYTSILQPSDLVVFDRKEKTYELIQNDLFKDNRGMINFDIDTETYLYRYRDYRQVILNLYKNAIKQNDFSICSNSLKNTQDVYLVFYPYPNYTYSLTINGITVNYTSTDNPDDYEIAYGLKQKIDNNEQLSDLVNTEIFYDESLYIQIKCYPNCFFNIQVYSGVFIICELKIFSKNRYKTININTETHQEYLYNTGFDSVNDIVKIPFYIDKKGADYLEVIKYPTENNNISKFEMSIYCYNNLVDKSIYEPVSLNEIDFTNIHPRFLPIIVMKNKYNILHTYHNKNFNFMLYAKSTYQSHKLYDVEPYKMFFEQGIVRLIKKLEVKYKVEYFAYVNDNTIKLENAEMNIYDYLVFGGYPQSYEPTLDDLKSGDYIYELTHPVYTNIGYFEDGTADISKNDNITRYFTDSSLDNLKLLFSYDTYPIKMYHTLKNTVDPNDEFYRYTLYPDYDFSKGYYPYSDQQALKERKWLIFDINGTYLEVEPPKRDDGSNWERLNGVVFI